MEKLKQGYKQTDIGVIPEGWEVFNVRQLGRFSKGNGISRAESQTGEIPSIRYGEIYTTHNDYIKDFHSFISASVAKNARKIKTGDLLFTASGETKEEIGKCVAFIDNIEAYAGGDILIISPDNRFNSLLLGFLLNAPYVVKQKANKGQGDAVVHITKDALSDIVIALPKETSEQTSLATALSDVDALIAALDKKITKKQQIKQGVMQQIFTCKKRLPGYSGAWVEKKLGEVGKINMGQSPSSQFYNNERNGLPLIQGNADIEKRKTIIRNYTSLITKQCESGDIILSVRAPVGAVAKATFNACIGRGVCSIRVSNDFLYHYLIFVENDWGQYSKGSTFDSISSNELSEILLIVPSSKSEQTAIAQVLTDIDNEISQLEADRNKYEQIKAGMMQQLLTGKIRLIKN